MESQIDTVQHKHSDSFKNPDKEAHGYFPKHLFSAPPTPGHVRSPQSTYVGRLGCPDVATIHVCEQTLSDPGTRPTVDTSISPGSPGFSWNDRWSQKILRMANPLV